LFIRDRTIVDEIKIEPKTKERVKVLDALKIDKRVLVVVTDADEAVVRAAGNIPNVYTLNSSQINVYDLIANAKCVMTRAAVQKIEEAYKA
ncbi:MAG: 50S ribosomal protein L4, partial [Clostridiales bacterium]|nr:50S ribosomal protein L4 [Clostridiales bacterium]